MNTYLEFLTEGRINYNAGDLRPKHDAIAAIMKRGDTLLMLDHVKFNFWTIPIGKVEPLQTVVQGLKQELKEEVNVIPISFKEVGTFQKTYRRENINVKITTYIFMVHSWRGTIKNMEPKKHRSLKWMTLEQLESLKKARKLSHSTLEAMKYMS